MKKYIISLLALLSVVSAVGDARSDAMLAKVASAVKSMSGYSVSFSVAAGDYSAEGAYVVRGDAYYMSLSGQEVYSDGKIRREVSGEKREVTIDAVDVKSRNILTNPTRAFDFVGLQYRSSVVSEVGGRAVIRLTPTDAKSSTGNILLTVSTSTWLPEELTYEVDGERVTVKIVKMSATTTAPKSFDAERYKGYEFIDFR